MISFGANGETSGYLAVPPLGRGPGVLVLQEWWGLVDHIKRVADRFAEAGFVALAPDLYRGESATQPDDAQRLLMAMDMAQTAESLQGAADYLRAYDTVSPKRVGVVGFCLGGQLALYAATSHPDQIDAVVDFYGIFNPRVPVDLTALRAPVLAHFGLHDKSIPVERAEQLIADIRANGADATVHFYDAGHAFFNNSRSTVYSAVAAQSAWERTIAFLESKLT